jgi:predicted secreted protein
MIVRQYFIFWMAIVLLLFTYSMNANLKLKNLSDAVVEISDETSDNSIYRVSVSTTQNLLVKIEGNITTGYQWFLENHNNIDWDVLRPLNVNSDGTTSSYVRGNGGRFGGGGEYHFYFQPITPGQLISLNFINKRAWSDGSIKRVKVIVSISG